MLRLRIERPTAQTREVAVEVDPEHQADELLRAICRHLEIEATGLALLRGPVPLWLDPGRLLKDLGIRDGDRLLMAEVGVRQQKHPAQAEDDALVDLLVAGGPRAGSVIPLTAGSHLVGRSPGCAVVIEDRSISASHLLVSVGSD